MAEALQPHTFGGERGDTPLAMIGGEGRELTYRDAYQAVLIGLNRAAGRPDDANPYGWDLDTIDPVAAAQNAAVYLEQMAGIYPNVPKLRTQHA